MKDHMFKTYAIMLFVMLMVAPMPAAEGPNAFWLGLAQDQTDQTWITPALKCSPHDCTAAWDRDCISESDLQPLPQQWRSIHDPSILYIRTNDVRFSGYGCDPRPVIRADTRTDPSFSGLTTTVAIDESWISVNLSDAKPPEDPFSAIKLGRPIAEQLSVSITEHLQKAWSLRRHESLDGEPDPVRPDDILVTPLIRTVDRGILYLVTYNHEESGIRIKDTHAIQGYSNTYRTLAHGLLMMDNGEHKIQIRSADLDQAQVMKGPELASAHFNFKALGRRYAIVVLGGYESVAYELYWFSGKASFMSKLIYATGC